ncbi:hypothetical protein [Sporosarcina sp. ANT_H38]|uniref:hypothetical protein n=1 Tax=Sporosarcina sp. ANT_H38 TaxID=2597358 RepID=UPI00165DEC37|nr:hypothetical protein [Sporosarcina sp. ANT_H38]
MINYYSLFTLNADTYLSIRHFELVGVEGANYHNQIDSYLNELLAIAVPEAVME